MNLLRLENVQAHYGASQALFDVNLEIAQGEVAALMGRNGMGKSTAIKSICRMVKSSGTILFDNQDLNALPSHRVARVGVGLVPEGRRCFSGLSVSENLIAAHRQGYWTLARIFELFPRLAERQEQQAGSLSGGEQQMLVIGRALMTNPRLLILDEATEGLAPIIRQEIWRVVNWLKSETGLSILIVDKSIKELGMVADTATILQRGKTVWNGAFSELDPDITKRYIGV